MGPLVDIWRLQSWSTCLFRYRFCSLANNDGKATQVRHSVVSRLSPLLSIMGCNDGPLELCLAPDVHTTSTVYGGLFWLYSLDTVFQSWSWKHYSYLDIISRTTCMPDLVPCQLFPYGLQRIKACDKLRGPKSRCLDDGVKDGEILSKLQSVFFAIMASVHRMYMSGWFSITSSFWDGRPHHVTTFRLMKSYRWMIPFF